MNTLSDEQLKELEGLLPLRICIVGDTVDKARHQMIHAFPALLSTIQSLKRERDEAVAESNRRDQKWMDGIDSIVGRKLRYTLATITDPPGFDLVPDLQDFIQSLRTELAAAKGGIVDLETGLLKIASQHTTDELEEKGFGHGDEEYAYNQCVLQARRTMKVKFGEDARVLLEAHLNSTLSQPPQSPWRPIAEAPKDGTRILACTIGSDVHRQWWSRDRQLWMIDYADGPSWQPTHWMPLPQPPTKGEESHECH